MIRLHFDRLLITIIITFLTFFKLKQTHPDHNYLILVVLIVQTFYSFALVFIICELCQRMTNSFDRYDTSLSKYQWHLFPHQIQKMLVMVIMTTQREVIFPCFGSLLCSREGFKQVNQVANINLS